MTTNRRLFITLFASYALVATGSFTMLNANAQDLTPSRAEPRLKDYEYTLPAGTMIPIMLQEDVSTEQAVVGQGVSAVIAQDLFIGAKRVLSRSDRVWGQVSRVEAPIKGRNAILKIDFDTLQLASGLRIPVSGEIDTGQESHCWGGEMTQGTKVEIVPYNVMRIGTYGRVMYGGPRAMGEHVKLLPGARIVLTLTEPVSLVAF